MFDEEENEDNEGMSDARFNSELKRFEEMMMEESSIYFDAEILEQIIEHFIINNQLKKGLKAVSVGLNPITVYNIWININPPGSYNHEHHHMNSILSGVYYIDAHESQGNINFMRSDGAEYHLQEEVINQVHHFNSSKTTCEDDGLSRDSTGPDKSWR